jgi:hypothetical protein
MTRTLREGTAPRLAVFAALLAAVGVAAAAVGALSGVDAGAVTPAEPSAMSGMGGAEEHGAAGPEASGLASTARGYTVVPARTRFPAGRSDFRFRVEDAQGRPARSFDVEGGVELHLIVARRDLVGYTHVHPALQADGSWSVPLDFARPGVYRAFVDFERDGAKTVLGTDLFVGGDFRPQPLPAPHTTAATAAYAVALAAPELHAGEPATLRFTVTRGGEPVRGLQQYVGARGHLVALRQGDLAYSHVHPLHGGRPGRISFRSELAEPGSYRLFLQFKTGGRVHTASFTIEVRR